MTQAVAVRQQGDDYQGRWFWHYAAELRDQEGAIEEVWFEDGPRSFDDVTVLYAPKRGPCGIDFRHLQCKWHATHGQFGFNDLINPDFINAETVSFLERAYRAWNEHQQSGRLCRLQLVTNWTLRPDDKLIELVRTNTGQIDVDKLFSTKTDGSGFGQVRKAWREKLGINEDELRRFASCLAICPTTDSLEAVREHLNDRFVRFGLKPVPQHQASYLYDDVIRKLHGEKQTRFNRKAFADLCVREGLVAESLAPMIPVFGVRTFMHPYDDMEGRCNGMLDLVDCFEGRFLRPGLTWGEDIQPKLKPFLTDALKANNRLRLVIEAHASVAFASGAAVTSKHGRFLEFEQRLGAGGVHHWHPADGHRAEGPKEPSVIVLDDSNPVRAAAVSITHDIASDVAGFLKNARCVGRLACVSPASGPSRTAICSGAHAYQLAEAIAQQLQGYRVQGHPMHLFIAAPNGFSFFLGQFKDILGPVSLYEFDFEGARTYAPSLQIT